MHEMFPVSAAIDAKRLKFTARELKSMVMPTKGLKFIYGEEEGLHHKSIASALFHKDLIERLRDEKLKSKKKAIKIIKDMHSQHVKGYKNKNKLIWQK